jgi:hypothetical protein
MPAKIMQRGAANLRVTDLVTALVISPVPPPLHNLLGHSAIKAALAAREAFAGPITSKTHVMQAIDLVVSQGLVTAARRTEIDQFVEADILTAIPIVLAGGIPVSQADLLDDEFQQLRHAAGNGAPATPPATQGRPPAFEVNHPDVRLFPGPNGTPMRITPVSRLQVMMVQTGYRRIPGDNRPLPQQVVTSYDDGQNRWYPGVLLYGEGVFIDVDPAGHEPVFTGPIADAWRHAWNTAQLAPAAAGDAFALPQPHPERVWWHTLSHRLINALAVDSGYSSSAVRERVYAHVDPTTGEAHGGVLLYTVQPGGDGTLGGLISLVPRFDRVLARAFRDLDACSNNVLCSDERFVAGKANGAACYACLLVSETSCEARNTGLDRLLLLDHLP